MTSLNLRLRRSPAWLVLTIGSFVLFSCASDEGRGVLVDPDAFGTDQGTLIGIADIRLVTDEMITSMNGNKRLAELRRDHSPINVFVGNFKHRTSIAVFDKEVFINQLLSNLDRADTDGAYSFLQRDSVQNERELQAAGVVTGGAPAKMQGAEYVLSGEVRELLTRTQQDGGTELEQRTIQYTLALTEVASGFLVWTKSHPIAKQQVIGAVYR